MATREQVRIEIAKPVHRDGILDIAEKVFTNNEPICESLKLSWDVMKEAWDKDVEISLAEPCSLVALNASNAVVGFRLSRILNLEDYRPDESIMDCVPSGPIKTMFDGLTKDWARILVNEQGEPSKKILQFIALAVHPDYGGQGLGEKMCRENLAVAEKLGCECCVVVGSNFRSQRIFEKLGFTTMARAKYSDYPEYQFQMADPRQIYSTAYYLKLGLGH